MFNGAVVLSIGALLLPASIYLRRMNKPRWPLYVKLGLAALCLAEFLSIVGNLINAAGGYELFSV